MSSLREALKCELARRDFYSYCRVLRPKVYQRDRFFLQDLCNKMQEFYYNDDEFMLINMPPRHGKSCTTERFVEWILGKNSLLRIISASYSHDLSKEFSTKVKNTIATERLDDNIVYNDIFPDTKIKYGAAEAMKWKTEASPQVNYLATSPGGSATGFGCEFMIIDDLIKNKYVANNERELEANWEWFTGTMLSRREGKKKVLVVMTRWNSKDLAGRLKEFLEEEGIKHTHINYKVEQENGDILCESIFGRKDVEKYKKLDYNTFQANYNQEPIDAKGCLYTNLLTYTELPEVITTIDNYTDTADKGKDYLCSINYAVDKNGYAYILDVLYTQESMETTEIKTAEMFIRDKVNFAHIESNNGGRGFARNVDRIMQERGHRHTKVKPFHQSKNKESRILTGSTGVMQNIYFPHDWKQRYPQFYKDVTGFQRAGDNLHDDCVDALTGVYEKITRNKNRMKINRI